MNLTELIGVYQARLQHLFGLVELGGSEERFREIKVAWADFKYASESGNKGEMKRNLDRLDTLLGDLDHDWLVWKDIDVAAGNMKKLIESERKRRIEMHALMPTTKVTGFARELVLAVRAEVTDPAVLARIYARVEEIVGAHPQVVEVEAG
jgi:hypothetical protein